MGRSASTRNPGAAMRLLVLGLLKRFGPTHGHAMRQYIHNAFLDQWADVQPGSLYYALDQLSKEGLIHPERTERVGQRPTRTIYRITPEGEVAFQAVLVSLLEAIRPLHDTFNLGLMFSPGIEDAQLAEIIRSRISRIREEVAIVRIGCDHSLGKGFISQRGAEIFRHIETRLVADIVWHEEFLVKLELGQAHGMAPQGAGGHPLFVEGALTVQRDPDGSVSSGVSAVGVQPV
ncbi:MAG: PadR family transcriptional regulator [Candidatus Sericytochromatia bacterium]|nr:PadR family transcriptional regulator [Candidatus Sericytochromatia bacterium]